MPAASRQACQALTGQVAALLPYGTGTVRGSVLETRTLTSRPLPSASSVRRAAMANPRSSMARSRSPKMSVSHFATIRCRAFQAYGGCLSAAALRLLCFLGLLAAILQ
ncbi:hypothetical protein A4V12_29780 [Streptomyces noursei]|nr:hypothetical protein A4V12_29780 [Streptomyces noursei]